MTTAHRPTWNAARGSDAQGGSLRGVASRQVSKFDATAHTKLHYRQEGQNAPAEVRARDFKAELEEKERRARDKRHRDDEHDREEEAKRPRLDQREANEKEEEKKPAVVFYPEDKDDSDSSLDRDSDSDSDSEEDDETAELMRELERIQKERQEEQKRLEKERQQANLITQSDAILRGNPLNAKDDFTVKKKWYEDTVFRNQTRGAPEQKKPRFINDTIRNDFHRRFLNKYIK